MWVYLGQAVLEPLETEDAVSLLQALGQERANDQPAAQTICKRVGNIPLFVQLAGHYLNRTQENAAEYLDWLNTSPLDALDFGDKQHESVRILLGNSLAKVSIDARFALGMMGCLALAPVDVAPVAAALGTDEAVARRTLGELVSFGLIQRQKLDYGLTHSLLHTYAYE